MKNLKIKLGGFNYYKIAVYAILSVAFFQEVFAQGPPPPPTPTPISGGVLVLLVGAAGYGINKLRNKPEE